MMEGRGEDSMQQASGWPSGEREREREEKGGARQGRLVSDHEEVPACSK